MISITIDNNLLLRTYQPADAQELFRCVNDSRQHLRPFLNWIDRTLKEEDSLKFIDYTQDQQASQQGLVLGIFQNEKLIGSIGMHSWNHLLNKAEIGYWIAKEKEGQGIMVRCAQRFVDFLFARLELNKIEIHFVQQNQRSYGLSQRLGAKVEGVIRQSYRLNGRLEDLVIAGILRSEWNLPA